MSAGLREASMVVFVKGPRGRQHELDGVEGLNGCEALVRGIDEIGLKSRPRGGGHWVLVPDRPGAVRIPLDCLLSESVRDGDVLRIVSSRSVSRASPLPGGRASLPQEVRRTGNEDGAPGTPAPFDRRAHLIPESHPTPATDLRPLRAWPGIGGFVAGMLATLAISGAPSGEQAPLPACRPEAFAAAVAPMARDGTAAPPVAPRPRATPFPEVIGAVPRPAAPISAPDREPVVPAATGCSAVALIDLRILADLIELIARGARYEPPRAPVAPSASPAGAESRVAPSVASRTHVEGSRLEVISRPGGAKIRLDGKPVRPVTPATLALSPGWHQLELEHAGYDDLELAVWSSGDEVRVRCELVEACDESGSH